MTLKMLERRQGNILRFALVMGGISYFYHALQQSTEYLEISRLPEFLQGVTQIHFSMIGVLITIFIILFTIIGGALSDKYGRKLFWSVELLLYAFSVLLLVFPSIIWQVTVGLGYFSSLFWASKIAWIYDHEGKEGMRRAYGFLYAMSPFFIMGGIGLSAVIDHFLGDVRVQFILPCFVIVIIALWVLTFPESPEKSTESLPTILTTGIYSFFHNKIFLLLLFHRILMDAALWIARSWELNLVQAFPSVPDQPTLIFGIITIVFTGLVGSGMLFMKRTDYARFTIYPAVLMAVFLGGLLIVPTPFLFSVLITGAFALSLVWWTGFYIVINSVITGTRATLLSLMYVTILLLEVPRIILYLLQVDIHVSCGIASLLACVSVFPLYIALKKTHHENPSLS